MHCVSVICDSINQSLTWSTNKVIRGLLMGKPFAFLLNLMCVCACMCVCMCVCSQLYSWCMSCIVRGVVLHGFPPKGEDHVYTEEQPLCFSAVYQVEARHETT